MPVLECVGDCVNIQFGASPIPSQRPCFMNSDGFGLFIVLRVDVPVNAHTSGFEINEMGTLTTRPQV